MLPQDILPVCSIPKIPLGSRTLYNKGSLLALHSCVKDVVCYYERLTRSSAALISTLASNWQIIAS